MAESFRVQGPVRIPRTAEHHKIGYQDHSKSKREEQESADRSSFQAMMERDEEKKAKSKITVEQVWDRVLPKCRIYLIDYEEIPGLRWKNFPLDLLFKSGIGEKELQNPVYLSTDEIETDSPRWKELLDHCRGNVVLIHPIQWQKMERDLEYAVMMATECRSVLAAEYAENRSKVSQKCVSCVVGMDRFGLSIPLFSTEASRKREGISEKALAKLRQERQKKTDKEHKQEFLAKLRQQKKGLEKYRYDTLVMNRVKTTAKLFDSGMVHLPDKAETAEEYFHEDEIPIALIELITGGL